MKLRQKLAMVLATAMVITAVPVTTMAASTNTFNKTLSIVADHKITTEDALFLTVKYDKKATETIQGLAQNKADTFFVNATNFEFDVNAYAADGYITSKLPEGVTITAKKDQLVVKVAAGAAVNETELAVDVAIAGTPKKGNPALTVDAEDSLATSGKYSLTGAEVVTDKVLVATAGDVKNISIEGAGSIADITIEEKVAGSLAGKTVTVTLPNSSDLIFNKKYDNTVDAKVSVEGKRGLAGVEAKVKAVYAKDDNKKLEITFGDEFKTDTRGAVVLKGIEVQAENKKGDVDTGEVKVTVKADKMEDTKLVVANVSDFGVSYTVDEVDELVAGQGTTKVKVKMKENAIDTLDKKRDIYFTIEEGQFVNVTTKAGFTLNADKDEITLNLATAGFEENKINEFEFEVEIAAEAQQEGPVTLVASSRNFEEDLKLEVAKVVPAFEVTAEPLKLQSGLKDQVGGKIVIKETKEDRLAKNKEIRIAAADTRYGIDVKDAKVEVTGGDVEIKSEVKGGEIIITVKRSSDEASEITISEIEVTTDRTVPQGKFDFQIGGDAISDLNKGDKVEDGKTVSKKFDDVIELKDFMAVGIETGVEAKEIVLTVGSTSYTVNGEAKTADATAFIDANNRTMVPVRFIAEEFGKVDFGTINGVGTVTVFNNGAVLQFQNGSNIMNKNGINIPMDTKVVIKDGRTYVPVKYVADGLGISYSYDAATKSITFGN